MTLLPTENCNVHGLETAIGPGGHHRDYPLNELCAVPRCFNKPTEAHHLWRRSAIGGDYWWVQVITDRDVANRDEAVYPNVVGLCHRHHNDVTTHLAWIRLTDEGFEWLTVYGARVVTPKSQAGWEGHGLLDPQPGDTEKHEPVPGRPCPRCRRKVPEPFKGEKKRKRVVLSYKVPKDEQEDGHEVMTTLMESCAKLLGREGEPIYYTEAEVHAWFLQTYGTDPRLRAEETPPE